MDFLPYSLDLFMLNSRHTLGKNYSSALDSRVYKSLQRKGEDNNDNRKHEGKVCEYGLEIEDVSFSRNRFACNNTP